MNLLRPLLGRASRGTLGPRITSFLAIGATFAATAISVQLTVTTPRGPLVDESFRVPDATLASSDSSSSARLATPKRRELASGDRSVTLPAPDERKLGRFNCTIVQTGGTTDNLWYFGGSNASNYSEVVSLTLTDARNQPTAPFQWAVIRGRGKVNFGNGRDRVITTSRSVELVATAASASASAPTPDVRIRVVGANGITCLFDTLVLRPDHLVFLGARDFPGPEGFFTETSYRTETQFNTTMPFLVELNVDWEPDISDFGGENWNWPAENGQPVNPALWCESVERCGPAFSTPAVMSPQSPLLTTKVDHRAGKFRIGSTTTNAGSPNPGVSVRSLKWQIYQDHSRHE